MVQNSRTHKAHITLVLNWLHLPHAGLQLQPLPYHMCDKTVLTVYTLHDVANACGMQDCLLPRCLYSAEDAAFAGNYVSLLTKLAVRWPVAFVYNMVSLPGCLMVIYSGPCNV